MSYTVRLAHPVVKVLDRLDRPTEQRLRRRLQQLAEKPNNAPLSKRVVAVEGLRASRVGDWRILFTVSEKKKTVPGLAIRPRGQAYRRL